MAEQPEVTAEPPEPEFDWHEVTSWPARARDLMEDIEGIGHVLELMAGTGDDTACQVFTDLLRTAQLAERRELAMIVLDLHAVALPEPGTMQTPQERMSSMMSHVADEVRKRRADIVPKEQPFTDRRSRRPGEQPRA